jgi:hypothetical protein
MDASPISSSQPRHRRRRRGTLEEAQATLVAIAPVVGSARIASAAGNILRAGMGAAALAEADQESVPGPWTP